MNPPAQSKINATALLIALVNLFAALGYFPDEVAAELVSAVNIICPMAIMVFRTWYTGPK